MKNVSRGFLSVCVLALKMPSWVNTIFFFFLVSEKLNALN